MTRRWLVVLLALAACEPAPQGALLPGYGEQFLDDGAFLQFDTGKSTMTLESEENLFRMMPQVRAALARLPAGDRRLCVAGHADSVGDESLNRALSLRRAQAVAERMIDHGVPIQELVVRGYGSARPFIDRPGGNPNNRVVMIARGEKCRG
jgi:outer membrane protein OmpA-like peptidoglycan-associated protein